jgi:hypothetical protein
VPQFDFQQMQEIFLFYWTDNGIHSTCYCVRTVHTFCGGQSTGSCGEGGCVLSSVYNKDPKCVNAVYTLHDQKSILDW